MATIIDVDKVQEGFDFLAETADGRAALDDLHLAVEKFQGRIQPQLNRGESIYILRQLMAQLNVHERQPAEVAGYDFSKVAGLLFPTSAGAITRSQALRSGLPIANFNRVLGSGFVIRTDN